MTAATGVLETFEIIDSKELARRWALPESWIRDASRSRRHGENMIPHIKFGRYVRFRWQSPELNEWLKHQMAR